MSTELYIQGYSASGSDGLEIKDVLDLFRVTHQPDGFGFYLLEYGPTNSCELSIQEESGKAVAVTISRPCKHEQFWTDVFQLLTRGPYLAFMPGSRSPVLVNLDVANHMPEGMEDALGSPKQVSSVVEMASYVVAE